RRRGVAAAEVLAARVEGRLAYRGALVTAEVPAAATLLEALRGAPDRAARRGLAAAAGRAVAGLHAAGVGHADLHLRNLVVLPSARVDAPRRRLLRGRIRRARADAWLGWAVEPPSAPLLAGHSWLDRVHVFERPRGARALVPFLRRVRAERYQVALDLGRGVKSALIAWASGAGERIGFARADAREGSWLLATRRLA